MQPLLELRLASVEAGEAGQYRCVAETGEAGGGPHYSGEVGGGVVGRTTATLHGGGVELLAGQTTSLHCNAQASLQHQCSVVQIPKLYV